MKRCVLLLTLRSFTEREVGVIDRPGLESYIDSNH
jgi:hypothetical protein